MGTKIDFAKPEESRMVVFQKKNIRRTLHNDEWWFSVIDVVAVLTDSVNPTDYIKKMRSRDSNLQKGGDNCHPLLLQTEGGNQRSTAPTRKAFFRIIQSIPPLKLNPLNAGWQKSAMSAYRKLKIRTGYKANKSALQGQRLFR